MRLYFRQSFIGALIALLLVTSHSLAMARADTARIAGQIVICMGHGVVMVHVDAKGEPVGPPRFCPDGVLALFDVASAAPVLSAPRWEARASHADLSMSPVSGAHLVEPKGRGPPSRV